jgi:hypothetical protein
MRSTTLQCRPFLALFTLIFIMIFVVCRLSEYVKILKLCFFPLLIYRFWSLKLCILFFCERILFNCCWISRFKAIETIRACFICKVILILIVIHGTLIWNSSLSFIIHVTWLIWYSWICFRLICISVVFFVYLWV